MKRNIIIFLLIVLGVIASCVYPFQPTDIEAGDEMIAIEGDIICGDTSVFVITKSLKLDESTRALQSLIANSVYVEDENGHIINARLQVETDKHYKDYTLYKYVADTRNIDHSLRYRLVVSVNMNLYYSEFVPVLVSPEIDSVTYKIAADRHSLDIRVNTFSDVDSLKYYRWEFVEDWEFTANAWAQLRFDEETGELVEIPYHDNNYYCWKNDKSADILVFSTEKLITNRVSEYPLTTIGYHDDRLSKLYAIEVSQKALTRNGYEYWSIVRKNNDETGGIFSPQPSEMRGNIISNYNPDEHVLGYISACKPTKKRIFLYRDAIRIYKDSRVCTSDTVPPEKWQSAYNRGFDVAYIIEGTSDVVWQNKICVNCRLSGTKKRPDFWPNKDI